MARREAIEYIQDVDIGLPDETGVVIRSLSAAKFQEAAFLPFVGGVFSKRSEKTLVIKSHQSIRFKSSRNGIYTFFGTLLISQQYCRMKARVVGLVGRWPGMSYFRLVPTITLASS